jgi:DNA ligase-associated metallophosphoesterase
MKNPVPYIIRNNTFWISPLRSLYWEEENTLLIADLHLGKSGHFRKSGIAVPQHVYKADLQRLIAQLYFYKAERLIIAGDFTHSTANRELELFMKWRHDFSGLQIDLVKGNHDILDDAWYEAANIRVSVHKLQAGPFLFLHDLKDQRTLTDTEKNLYHFAGHLHPGVLLKGLARQHMKLPCFYFTPGYCVLPAFSRFTGNFIVRPSKGELVYAITGEEVTLLR